MSNEQMTAISLFSSGGIGDLALRKAGFNILVSNELLTDRHAVFEYNFPDTTLITGDIWEELDRIQIQTWERLCGRELTLLYATPPCQGMSKNGRGKLLSAIRSGRKPALDERNRLVVPAMKLARHLRPEIILFENVPEMADTLIVDEEGIPIKIVDFIERELGSEYSGCAEVIEFADFGIPQRRKRLISVFSRNRRIKEHLHYLGTLMPSATHSENGQEGTYPWLTVREIIADLPTLDAGDAESATSDIPYHRVPLLDSMKYWWVDNTPAERSAFDNQCIECGFDDNRIHTARRDDKGINRASKETPLYCEECGEMLPRPSVLRNGKRKLMHGYTSAYKRMSYDKPASALTRNLSYACSDKKLHPKQNRVLSLYEAFKLHSLDHYEYYWRRTDGKTVRDKTIREIIGESIPPAGLETIISHLTGIYNGEEENSYKIGPLFSFHSD